MAVITPQQGNLDFPSVQQFPIDTYVRRNPNVSNPAASLVQSLNGFATTLDEQQRQNKDETNFAENAKVPEYVAQLEHDNQLGLADMAMMGKIAPQASPKVQMSLLEATGQRAYEKVYEPQFASLVNDPTLQTDPSKLQDWYAKQRAEIVEKTKDNPIYGSGALKALDGTYNKAYSLLTGKQADNMKADGIDGFQKTVKPGLLQAQQVALDAAKQVGVAPGYMAAVLSIANPNGDPGQVNKTKVTDPLTGNVVRATASGLMDITDGTWSGIVQKYGSQYGLTIDGKNDPKQSALGAALLAKDNIAALSANKDLFPSPQSVTPGDVACAHYFGAGAYMDLLKAEKANPNTPVSSVFKQTTMMLNKGDMLNPDGSPLTVSQLIHNIQDKSHKADFTSQPTKRFDGTQPFVMNQDSFASKNYQWTDFKNNGVYGGNGSLDGRLVNMLDAVTDQFGKGKLTLTSAFRDSFYNRGASYTKDSEHSHGDAIDIDVSKYSDADKAKLVSLFTAAGARGLGHYDNGTIHVDLRAAHGNGSQPDGMALWYHNSSGEQSYTSANPWFSQGIDEGRQMRKTGFVPVAGFNGQPLNAWESMVKSGSSYGLTPREASNTAVTTLINEAANRKDPSVLDVIPIDSLPVAQQDLIKAKKIEIANQANTEWRQRVADSETSQKLAKENRLQEFTQSLLNGDPIDLNKMSMITYKDETGQMKTAPDLALLKTMQEAINKPPIDERMAISNASNFEQKFLTGTITGDYKDAFKDDPETTKWLNNLGHTPTTFDWNNFVATSKQFDKDRTAYLVGKMQSSKEWTTVIYEPQTANTYSVLQQTMDHQIKNDYESGLFSKFDPQMNKSLAELPGQARDLFYKNFTDQIQAYAATNKHMPNEIEKMDMREKAADKAQKFFDTNFAVIKKRAEGMKSGQAVEAPESQFNEGQTVSGKSSDGTAVSGNVVQVRSGFVVVKDAASGLNYVMTPDMIAGGTKPSTPAATTPAPAPQASTTPAQTTPVVPQIVDDQGKITFDLKQAGEIAKSIADQINAANSNVAAEASAKQQKAQDAVVANEIVQTEKAQQQSLDVQAHREAINSLLESDKNFKDKAALVHQLKRIGKVNEAQAVEDSMEADVQSYLSKRKK